MNTMNNRLTENPRESKDPLMDLVIETFELIVDNIELYHENKRLKERIKNLETFIRGIGKSIN